VTVRLPKARVTLDIDHALLVWITTYAKEQGKSRNEVVGEAVERFRTAKEGRKMTTAERVAQMLGDDGTKFEAEDGRTLDELEEVIGTSDWEEAVRRVKAWQDRAESAVDLVQQLRGAWCSEHCTFNGNLCNECVEKDCTGRQTQQWLTAGAGE